MPSLARDGGRRIPLELEELGWDGFVKDMTENYPDLAKRFLSDSGGLARGMAIAVNDEMFGSNEKNAENMEFVEQNNADAEIETPASLAEENNEHQIRIPPLPDLNQEPAETNLTFQPYHTVDYFASQGIKFVPEEKPTDRFGKQLRSFTEWLKTMKRLPQIEVSNVTDIVSEEKVEQMAEHSIDQREVITETMAEVWIKQGNKEKAIETYNKLSLLNPDKSAYFASLAEQLKNS